MRGYGLQLDDGTRWRIRPTAAMEDWLRRFASIMGLASTDRGRSDLTILLHTATDAGMSRTPGTWNGPDREGGIWDFRRVPGAIIRRGLTGHEITCLLSEAGDAEMEIEWMRHLLLPLYLDILSRDGLPVHAALAERGGRGILLAGRSGIGKSTCCRRLPLPWRGLADDLALVIRDSSGKYRAHPLPTWSAVRAGFEGTWNVGRSVPLEAVFFLDQSESDEVVPVGKGAAAFGCSQSANEVLRSVGPFQLDGRQVNVGSRVFENAADLCLAVPAYLLRVSLEGRFWEKIEEAIGLGA